MAFSMWQQYCSTQQENKPLQSNQQLCRAFWELAKRQCRGEKSQQQRNPSKISTLQLLLTQHKPRDQESSDLSHPAELSLIQIPDLPPGLLLLSSEAEKEQLEWGCNVSREAGISCM